MTKVENYLNDGANWQAQSVLAYVRTYSEVALDFTFDKEKMKNLAYVKVGRLENCREQGYIFRCFYDWNSIINIAVYEHRNCDSIVVKEFKSDSLNTPTIDEIPMKDKWDYDKSFDYGNIVEAGEYILKRMEECIKEYLKEPKEQED